MKYLSHVLLFTSTLLTSTTVEGNGDAAEHYANSDAKVSCSMVYLEGDRRFRSKTVDKAGSITAMVEVKTNSSSSSTSDSCDGPGCRKLSAKLIDDNTVPWPAGGDEEFKVGNAIYFREEVGGDSPISDVHCYHIKKTNEPTRELEICAEDGVSFDESTDSSGSKSITSIQLTGFEIGEWEWYATDVFGTPSVDVTKTDGNGGPHSFIVKTLPKLARTSAKVVEKEIVEEAEWLKSGQIQEATGRIYYSSMGWDYACSGTAITDRKSGRSLIFTAAHCVWDDIDEVWGSNAIFIPNRDAIQTNLTGSDIKRQCDQDICGCWTLSAGLTLSKWRDEYWPDRLAYDYGVWVVDDEGAHTGASCGSEALDEAVDEMEFAVGVDLEGVHTHALGYSLEHNPDFRYCSDNTGFNQPTEDVDTYWLPGCGLVGGASGGPWCIDMDNSGKCKIVSVNSWSLTDKSGMGGPIIEESAVRCLVNAAREVDFKAVSELPEGEQGVFVECHDRPCIPHNQETEYRRLRGGLDGRKLCEN